MKRPSEKDNSSEELKPSVRFKLALNRDASIEQCTAEVEGMITRLKKTNEGLETPYKSVIKI